MYIYIYIYTLWYIYIEFMFCPGAFESQASCAEGFEGAGLGGLHEVRPRGHWRTCKGHLQTLPAVTRRRWERFKFHQEGFFFE